MNQTIAPPIITVQYRKGWYYYSATKLLKGNILQVGPFPSNDEAVLHFEQNESGETTPLFRARLMDKCHA